MADTVKKSRIVSEDDTDLEEALLEEFNQRLKNCMSQDDLEETTEKEEENIYENLRCHPKTITSDVISASKSFIENEISENYYEEPRKITNLNGHGKSDDKNKEEEDEENIYENIPEKTEVADQNYVDMNENNSNKKDLKLDVSNDSTKLEYELMGKSNKSETSTYEEVETHQVIQPDKPSFALPTTSLTDYSELESETFETKSSVKDRMFLSCDDKTTLLFTQTVTSPMLTPSEENIDFLKGFQRENTTSDSTTSNISPPREETKNLDEVDEKQDTSEVSAEISVSEPLEEDRVNGDDEEKIYENAEFLKNNVDGVYENVNNCKTETIYENVNNSVEENIYQNIEECLEEKQEVIEENQSPDTGVDIVIEDFDLKENIEEFLKNERDTAEPTEQIHETTNENEKIEGNVVIEKTVAETINENVSINSGETYSELIQHTKSETNSNYYEKYTEVVMKNSKNEVSNREKDTETVPAEIVKNLKSQFLTKTGVEIVGLTKKENNTSTVKTVNIIKQIHKFEHKNGGDAENDDSTEYSETIVETDNPGEKCIIKKKKVKKTRKEEKENISVQRNGLDEENFYNVNVKNLCRSFGDLTKIDDEKASNRLIKTNERWKSSFSKFDALQKKNVLHVRSSDSSKAQEKFNGAQIDTTSCKKCGKQVFQMEQIKAERAVWHKNCFRCTECSKQLTVDIYESHEGSLYCKPHFKALFAPKVVEDETPPSDKPDLGLEELQSLNVKERFQVFEHHQTETDEVDRVVAPINVKRSPSILSKLARFQKHGMDVGVSNEALDGVPIEESSSEEEEEEEFEEGEDADLVRAKRVQKEKPFHFTGMSDVKKKWEQGDQNGKEERREERKQEIQTIRNRLFMGKQEKMKEAYQQAVMESESSTNLKKNSSEKIEACDTRSIKERFEKGEVANEKLNKEKNDEEEVYESEMSKKSRSLFLELDANASKPPQMSPVTPPKLEVKKARETETPEREIYRDPDVVRSEEYVEDSTIAKERHTATKMLNKFRQMEENIGKESQPTGLKPLKRFTPPPEPARPESSEGESGSEYEEEEEEEEEEVVEHGKLPEDLIEAQKAARAKQLRAKFEKWEANEIKKEQQNCINVQEEYTEEQSQIESTRVLRAKFESMKETTSSKSSTPRVKVNRFVGVPSITDFCQSCNDIVYPLEKISVHGHIYHKQCFKCMECSCVLRMDSYSYNQGLLYCTPHFKRLFITKGNYDSAFGLDQHKEKLNATVA